MAKSTRVVAQLPPMFNATSKSLIEDAKNVITQSSDLQDHLVNSISPKDATFNNIVLPLVHVENLRVLQRYTSALYSSASPDKSLRDAARAVQSMFEDFAAASAVREDVYKLISAVKDKNEDIDRESKHLLEKMHQHYGRRGLAIPDGPDRARFRQIRSRISELESEFYENLTKKEGELWLSEGELAGVSELILSRLERGVGEHKGKFRLPFGDRSFDEVGGSATSGQTRRRVALAKANMYTLNIALIEEALALRHEAAHLLGYRNHAALRLEEKMAKTPETVNSFLKRLKTGLIQLRQEHSIDPKAISEYFVLDIVVERMIRIFEDLFRIEFVEITEGDTNCPIRDVADHVWHKDVRMMAVWDNTHQGGGFLGYLYLDLWEREGKKASPSHSSISPGFLKEDGTRRFPASALLWSFSRPDPGMPCLIRNSQVVMLFHELGHGIHDLVSKTAYARFYGPPGTCVDFGEAPSQLLENWFSTPSIIIGLSQHYSTVSPEYEKTWLARSGAAAIPPEKMPEEMVERLLRARQVSKGLYYLYQVFLASFDMAVHQPPSQEPMTTAEIAAIYSDLMHEVYLVDKPDHDDGGKENWGSGYASFGHMMGDYDAGYYSYLFSEVYSVDLFDTYFADNPMNADIASKYRHGLLEKGGSLPEMTTLVEFLGREPDIVPFCKKLGIR
ncbi:metallopeptidase MepB [Xylariales sp. PMI_506]|nr:metallopeptidase MepB [Xylariales sp. PMI_506]